MSLRTHKEILEEIAKTQKDYKHILTGSVATVTINAPRALLQCSVESKLQTLHWVIGKKYKSQLKGND